MPAILRAARLALSQESSDDAAPEPLSIAFESGTVTSLRGEEGCGKNRLLRLLGLLERPLSGEIFLHDAPTAGLSDAERLALRNRHFGFVFADPFLLNTFTVLENLAMPLFKISGIGLEEARVQTGALLDFAGLRHVSDRPVGSLTLLEQRKVSLARALANQPAILLVENAVSELAEPELAEFTELLLRSHETFAATVVMTLSDSSRVAGAHRVIEFSRAGILRDSAAISLT